MPKELELIKLLCKHYYIDSLTGELKEIKNKRCGNEDEIDKLNKLFKEFKDKSKYYEKAKQS